MTDLTTILQGHLLTQTTPGAPAEAQFEPTIDDTPGLGLDSEYSESHYDTLQVLKVQDSLESLLASLARYAQEGLTEQGMHFANVSLTHLAHTCDYSFPSLEDGSVVSVENKAQDFLQSVMKVLKKLWSKLVDIFMRLVEQFQNAFSQLSARSKKLAAEAKSLMSKWVVGEKIHVAGKWNYLSYNDNPVGDIAPLENFLMVSNDYLKSSWIWAHAVRLCNNSAKSYFEGKLGTIPPMNTLAFSAPHGFTPSSVPHSDPNLATYATKELIGGRKYALNLMKDSATARPGHTGAVHLSAEGWESGKTDSFEIALAKPEFFQTIQTAINNVKSNSSYSADWAKEAEEMFDRANSAHTTFRMKALETGKEDEGLRSITEVMKLSGTTAMGILNGVRLVINDSYHILKAHLDWAEASLEYVKKKA